MTNALTLAIDVGTGSVRAALVDGAGRIVTIAAREHDQIVPRFGWAEQRPADWWAGVVAAIRTVLADVPDARSRIAVVVACGQMHGTVLVDADGNLTRELVPLWNDKRTIDLVRDFERAHAPEAYLAESGNPPTPAWPGFKLAWLRDNDPEAYARAAHVIMPKDYINLRLTGEIAMDEGDASCSFLMNPATRQWSPAMVERLGLDGTKLPPIRNPLEILGHIMDAAAVETGLASGTPVLVGGADYPVALLGSGTCRPGLVSDVTGTSCILTLIAPAPLLDPDISNVATVEGNWGPFALLESGGDAMRWSRRALHEGKESYEQLVSRAEAAPVGSDGLFFLPFLTGERLGAHRNARAQFFGLGAAHTLSHINRSILEGVAFAGARHLGIMEKASGQKIERVIASGGGAKTELWLRIKASVYGVPIVVPEEQECGILGCAAMGAVATGQFSSLDQAVGAFVRYTDEIKPDPAWQAKYRRMQPIFDKLYFNSQSLYDDLDALAAASGMNEEAMYLELFSLKDKTAVITGAARGIGFATADALSEAGAKVVITDMNGEAAAKAASELTAKGREVFSEVLDVTDPRAVEAVHAAIVAKHGRVDILVNNAGIAISNRPAETMDDPTWLKVLDVNLNGVFWCCRTFGKAMLEQGGGNIVNVGSMSADIVNRPQEQSQYNASKAGVHHLTRSLAAEWATRNVRVNAVAPTYIETELTRYVYDDPDMMKHWVGNTPMNRMGQPPEIAAVILFLASEASSLMTGSIVAADGGYTLW